MAARENWFCCRGRKLREDWHLKNTSGRERKRKKERERERERKKEKEKERERERERESMREK